MAEMLKEHVADYDELLPHVFMGEVSRYVASEAECTQQIVEYLEQRFRERNEDIQELIAVSFVENFPRREDFERALKGVDADALREEWQRQQGS